MWLVVEKACLGMMTLLFTGSRDPSNGNGVLPEVGALTGLELHFKILHQPCFSLDCTTSASSE